MPFPLDTLTPGERSERMGRVRCKDTNFGVPQKRERLFIVGIRSDLGVNWSFPRKTHDLDALLWSQ